MATNRPSSKWQLSPVQEHWFVIRIVVFLSNQLQQFGCYDMYKDDTYYGLEIFNFASNKTEKMLQRHAFILRPIYQLCYQMKYYNITTPLPAVGGLYDMNKINPNPTYPTLKLL